MAIVVKLDDLLHERRMTLTDLADRIGMALPNLSSLKTGNARAIRFSTLMAICEALAFRPGDVLKFDQVEAARGELVARMDADDVCHPLSGPASSRSRAGSLADEAQARGHGDVVARA